MYRALRNSLLCAHLGYHSGLLEVGDRNSLIELFVSRLVSEVYRFGVGTDSFCNISDDIFVSCRVLECHKRQKHENQYL